MTRSETKMARISQSEIYCAGYHLVQEVWFRIGETAGNMDKQKATLSANKKQNLFVV